MKPQIIKPKKVGRPRVFAEPMTNKQRQQRWRDRVKAEAQSLLDAVK